MKYENYEKMIIDRLQKCQELDILACEIDSSVLSRQKSFKPSVYVLYQGSQYEDPETLSMIAQMETMTFEIVIIARKLRGKSGIYAAFEIITKKLLGYREKGMRTPVIFQKFGYVSEMQGTYQYALQCSFTGYIVQSYDEDAEKPLLIQKITNNITDKE